MMLKVIVVTNPFNPSPGIGEQYNEKIRFVSPKEIEEIKATKDLNLLEQRLIDTLERAWSDCKDWIQIAKDHGWKKET